jgi:two-component system cell cycle sensor histidine kinase/response regulator CckA
MEKSVQERIFEPFFTTKDIGKGTGMGLPAAYGTVKHLGGDIFVESNLGVGSDLYIYLPFFKAEKKVIPPPLKILI